MVWARCVGRTLPKLPCHLAKRWNAHYLGADNSHLKDQISRRAEYGDGAGDALATTKYSASRRGLEWKRVGVRGQCRSPHAQSYWTATLLCL